MGDIQVDLLAYMATVETKNNPLMMCNSCQRALIYGAVMYASDAMLELEKALGTGDLEYVRRSTKSLGTVGKVLAEFIKADIHGCMPESAGLDREGWSVAIESFVRARTEQYVTEEGVIKMDHHGGDSDQPAVTV